MSSFQGLDPPVGVGFRVPTPLFLVSFYLILISNILNNRRINMLYIQRKKSKDTNQYLFQITYKDEEFEYFYSTYKDLYKSIDDLKNKDNFQSVSLVLEDNQK